jgi:hypothetical protein
VSEEIYESLKILNEGNFTWGEDIPNNEILPDGGIEFGSASASELTFTLQINDIRSQEYHR